MARNNPHSKSAKKTASRTGLTSKALLFTLPLAIPAALWSGQLRLPSALQHYLWPAPAQQVEVESPSTLELCPSHRYTTEIVSLDPLIIYINNFTSPEEARDLIKAGESEFKESFISHHTGRNIKNAGRISQSAPLEPDLPLVGCILNRARTFMGSMLQPYEPFSVPQLVKYHPSQRYDLHTDFWLTHQPLNDGSGRSFNRVASFFVFLKTNCTGGETHFPFVNVLEKDKKEGGRLDVVFGDKVTAHEKGGVAFKPVLGSAIFWVNLDEEGRGDPRVRHAGLAVEEGEKIGLNIWPRKYY